MIFEWIYKILFHIDFINLSVVSEQTTINHVWTTIHISMCVEIYFLYAVIDIYLIFWLFLFGEVENQKKKNSFVIDWYMWYVDCFYSKIESMDKNMRTCVMPKPKRIQSLRKTFQKYLLIFPSWQFNPKFIIKVPTSRIIIKISSMILSK